MQLCLFLIIFYSFKISGGNEERKFCVDALTGNIFVHAPLDQETTSSFHLTVEVSDNPVGISNKKSDVMYVEVTLNDVNDNSPIFKTNVLLCCCQGNRGRQF